MKAPDRIRAYVARHYAAKYVERVTADLIDVAAGNRPGNCHEQVTIARIFPECRGCGRAKEHPEAVVCWDCFKGRNRTRPPLKDFRGDLEQWLAATVSA